MNPDCGENAISMWKKQLRFRAWHRGTRESDLLIGNFADEMLADMDETALKQFEQLLLCSDPDLYDWMTGRSTPPLEHDHLVMQRLKEFRLFRANR